jgi:hypothetical protein
MQAYDELVERLAHLHRVSARDEGAAAAMGPAKKRAPSGTETPHWLYSPAQDIPPADARVTLRPTATATMEDIRPASAIVEFTPAPSTASTNGLRGARHGAR